MHKYFVIDTNVLLHTRFALESFQDNTVVLPMTVIEELDRFKSRADELGRNARATIRYIDGLREEEEKKANETGRKPRGLLEGIDNHVGGRLMVTLDEDMPVVPGMEVNLADNCILRAAYSLLKNGDRVVLVTKDLNLRIMADIADITTQDWNQDKIEIDDLYPGFQEKQVDSNLINKFYTDNELTLDGTDLFPNEFVCLLGADQSKQSALGRAVAGDKIVALNKDWQKIFGISGRSREQKMALQLLMDPEITLVTLVGSAGTGKTLLALAAGLEAIRRQDEALKNGRESIYRYEKLLVSRPIMPMGKDIGYLPGSKNQKLVQWMQPIFDNLAYLMHVGPGGGSHTIGKVADRKIQELIDEGTVELEALTYIRGRSIPRQFVVVDEAQNLTPHEIKTIVSRAGEGTKIVLTGDPYQIDNPYLDSASNGLSYAVERMKHLKLAGHITLKRAERSELAAAAAAEL